MTQAARLERLESKVKHLERRLARVAFDPEEERIRARTLILEHLRKHKSIDGWKFAATHGLVWNDVMEAMEDLEKLGTLERVDDE